MVSYALGNARLTWFEENFLNPMKRRFYRQVVWLSDKEQVVIQQIKDKLHYDRQDVPLPSIDLDGVEANDDPDGWPTVRDDAVDQSEDDALVDYLSAA